MEALRRVSGVSVAVATVGCKARMVKAVLLILAVVVVGVRLKVQLAPAAPASSS